VIPLLCVLLLQGAQAPASHPATSSSYVPQRVYDTHRKAFTDFESMLADLGRADVVFVGEQHDNPSTHRLELALLEGLTRRGTSLVLAMEMFERDAQPAIDRYVAGTETEEQFLGASRPWPRYATDYRPSVEFARAHRIPIVASNVPRRIASDVSKKGIGALDSLGPDRHLAAAEPHCPVKGDYYDRFVNMMREHPGAAGSAPAENRERDDRFYFAQCLKDETMGESIAMTVQAEPAASHAAIIHLNGAFHSDFGQGAAESARRRLRGRRIMIVSILPTDNLDAPRPGKDERKRADYLVYTIK
jgi:uncharacterized iron-regulated protein